LSFREGDGQQKVGNDKKPYVTEVNRETRTQELEMVAKGGGTQEDEENLSPLRS